ncbi:hypothetical protein WJX75_007121 [Coccomyxa subellipsoidea]|uniref:Fe2OG dioxygenase domain-containing protein n=1 Tax=Coccomyxa subellipsoidea TaxID=248742 RepID=A0ABR2YMS5_9CHLO
MAGGAGQGVGTDRPGLSGEDNMSSIFAMQAFDITSEENPSFVAWNYYPPVTEEQEAAAKSGKLPPRLHAHADMDVLTILYQREGDIGLEIAPGNEIEDLSLIEDVSNIWNHVPVAREWTPLDPKPGLLTVNIGDGLTRWTDGLLKSTYHRVRAPKEGDPKGARYSIPYFVNPKLNYVIQGPEKRFTPVTGFDLLSKTGNAYVARKNDPEKTWQKKAYTEEDVGFFYIAGHGIPQDDFDAALKAGQAFLALPDEVKAQWPFNPDTYLGHRGPDELETVTGNRLWEWWSVGKYGTGGYDLKRQRFRGEEWPEVLGKEWVATVLGFQKKVHRVSVIILKALFIALGRDETIVEEAFDINSEDNPSFVAWNYYPAVTEDREAAAKLPPRLHAHADMDVLTILYQREGDAGLEIAPGNEVEDQSLVEDVGNAWNHVPVARKWTPMDPKPGLLTVNIGDGLTRWTDGLLKSTYHRVRAPKEGDPKGARYSIPYFVNPKLNYVIQGPDKRFPPVTGFDLLSKTGNAYVARKNDPEKAWQKKAYSDEHAHLSVAASAVTAVEA